MFKHFILLSSLFLSSFILLSCSALVHKKSIFLPSNKTYAITSFWNYTETPMAGLRASSIVESVLSKENIVLHSLIDTSDNIQVAMGKKKLFNLQKEEAKKMGVHYLITGSVQEWQYKIGIDAEPVVSYTIKIIDLTTNSIVLNSVGAKSAWGHKSIGVVAQEIAKELIPKFIK